MPTRPLLSLTAAAAAAVLALAACGSSAEEAADMPASSRPSATTPSVAASDAGTGTAADDAMLAGAYLTKAEYQDRMAAREGTAVVYFFHAPWCPDCRATEEAIDTDGVPAGLTVVKVDFDSETDLRRQYGVTQQHTFVQVGPDGEQLAKWTGSRNGAEIKAETV